jgi:DNA-binding transcriptional LysR family regulator
VSLDVTLEASAPGAVGDLAARGLGVAVLSDSTAAGRPGLCPVPIEGPLASASLALIWRPPPGPALRELIGHCRRAFTAARGPVPPAGRSRGS